MPVRAAMILLGIPSSHRIINPDPQQASREEVSSLSLVLTVPGDRDAEYRACTLKCLICDKSQAAAAHLPAPVRPISPSRQQSTQVPDHSHAHLDIPSHYC
jgi:hypothetical protein